MNRKEIKELKEDNEYKLKFYSMRLKFFIVVYIALNATAVNSQIFLFTTLLLLIFSASYVFFRYLRP
jgi:hypothetical protein